MKHRSDLRVLHAVSYTLVFLMLTCTVMTVVTMIASMFPDWASGAMAGIILIVVVDRLLMHSRVKNLDSYSLDWFLTLGAQWVVIALLGRMLLSFTHGSWRDLITAEYIVTLVFAALIWDWAGRFLNLLDVIGLDPARALALREDASIKETEQVPVHKRLANLTFSLGIFVVILAALTRFDLRALSPGVIDPWRNDTGRFSAAEAGVLLYFLFSLGLISVSRLLALRTHWIQQRIPVMSDDLGRRWGRYALTFLLLLAVIVSLLPAGDSLGFFAVLASLIAFLVNAFFIVAQLLILLISLVINLPNLLMGRPMTWLNPFDALVPPEPPAPVDAGESMPAAAILAFLRSVLLWGSLVAITFFSIRQFMRGHEGLAERLRRSRIAQLVMLAWRWLTGSVEAGGGNLARAIADTWSALRGRFDGPGSALPRTGWLSLRSLDPRRQIYFYYLAMVRRGGEQGVERKTSQTPTEYAAQLKATLPDAQEEIGSLTSGFMEARYSAHAVTSDDSKRVKSAWAQVRRALGLQTRRRM